MADKEVDNPLIPAFFTQDSVDLPSNVGKTLVFTGQHLQLEFLDRHPYPITKVGSSILGQSASQVKDEP